MRLVRTARAVHAAARRDVPHRWVPPAAASGAPPSRPRQAIAWHACEDGFQCGDADGAARPRGARGADHRPGGDPEAGARPAPTASARSCSTPAGPGAPGVSLPHRDRVDACRPRCATGSISSASTRAASAAAARSGARTRSMGSSTSRSSPTTSAARTGLVDGVTTLAQACAARSGNLLAHVSTADTVQRPRTAPRRAGRGSAVVRRVLLRHVPRRQLRRRVPRARARLRARRPGRPDPQRHAGHARPGAWLRARDRRLPRRLLEPPGMLVPQRR